MPRKFKLIESYPHPKYMLIVGLTIELQGSIYVEDGIKRESQKMTFGKEIENYPQYWEEIIELPKSFTIEDMESAFDRGEKSGLADFNNNYIAINFKNWIQDYVKDKSKNNKG